MRFALAVRTVCAVWLFCVSTLQAAESIVEGWTRDGFHWKSTDAILSVGPGKDAADPHLSVKDPTFVFADGMWHLFTTLRMKSGHVDMEYLQFRDWKDAEKAERTVLNWHNQYNCAPQVFYFTPHKKWYLIYQMTDTNRALKFGPYFSTTEKIGDIKSWTKPEPMIRRVESTPKWIDFWVICDEAKAYLLYTSNDGHMWRRETAKANFPLGWSEQKLALQADIFEASHTYKIKGTSQYLTVIEAIGNNRRYYKAYVADHLDGEWKPVADSLKHPFASNENVDQEHEWTSNISHGELFRSGVDELMEIDPANLKFLIQGASDAEYRGKGYGGIPWRLGILEQTKP